MLFVPRGKACCGSRVAAWGIWPPAPQYRSHSDENCLPCEVCAVYRKGTKNCTCSWELGGKWNFGRCCFAHRIFHQSGNIEAIWKGMINSSWLIIIQYKFHLVCVFFLRRFASIWREQVKCIVPGWRYLQLTLLRSLSFFWSLVSVKRGKSYKKGSFTISK